MSRYFTCPVPVKFSHLFDDQLGEEAGDSEVPPRVRRAALTRHYTRLTAAAVDPPDTNIVLGEYQATSENLPELKGENQPRIKQTSAMKEIIPYPVLAQQIQTFL